MDAEQEHDALYNLAERIEDVYTENDSNICAYMRDNDSDYMMIMADVKKVHEAFPIIREMLDSDGEISLTPAEHKALIRYLDFKSELEDMERKRIYFRGHADGFSYLKLIGVI